MNADPSGRSLSVVIPFYGDPQPTISLVEGLMRSPGRYLGRIVVSDDCSPTPFPHDHRGPDDSPVELLVRRRSRNGGFGQAVNSGMDEVDTPLCLVLNSDVHMEGAQIDALVEAASAHQPVVASPQVVGTDGALQFSGRHFPTIVHQVTEWLTPLARFRSWRALHALVGHDVAAAEATAPAAVDWVMGAVMLLPTQVVRSVGGFDDRFYMNSEEVDLQRRLREIGVGAMVFPRIRVEHEGGGSSLPQLRRRWLVDSRFTYARIWGHPGALRAALRAATLVNFAVNMARRASGSDVRPRAVLREEWELLR